MKVYADNAATTKMSQTAKEAMMPYLDEFYGNPSSLYSFGQAAKTALEDARAKVAAALNADPKEIYFTSGGSEADNQAILSAVQIGARKGKKHIIRVFCFNSVAIAESKPFFVYVCNGFFKTGYPVFVVKKVSLDMPVWPLYVIFLVQEGELLLN